MKRNRVTRIAIILGVSLLTLALLAGVALAAGGAQGRVRDRTKSQLCDGSCKVASAGSAAGGTQTKAQDKTQTRSQVCDGSCKTK
jgi:hypothetical protein